MKTIDYFDERFYLINDRYLPSVTTILGRFVEPYLLKWYGDNGTERALWKSEQAKRKGSTIHNGIYLLSKGITLHYSDYKQEEWLQIMRFIEFYKALKPKVIQSEYTVYDENLGYAGTLDLAIELEGGSYNLGKSKEVELKKGIYIVDYKTGSEGYKYFAQLGSYAHAYEQLSGNDVEGTMLLYLNSNTKQGWKVEYRSRDRWLRDFEVFLNYLNIYLDEGEDKPKQIELPLTLTLEEL